MHSFDINCDGYAVQADWYDGTDTSHIILFLIGWTSSKESYPDLIHALTNATGHSALVFNYSGHGDSPFDVQQTRPAQHFLEVIHVFDWLSKEYPHASITVIGTSYGGFMATQLTKYRTFDRLILRVPAIYRPQDFYTIAADRDTQVTDKFRNDPTALAEHPLLTRAATYGGKTLVVVHENDEQVPTTTTDAYISAFAADAYIAKGFPHSMSAAPRTLYPDYQTSIANWITKNTVK